MRSREFVLVLEILKEITSLRGEFREI